MVRMGAFKTTRWSIVLSARDNLSADAMATLCGQYWKPLYAYALRSGHMTEEAQDLTQGFFLNFLDGRYLKNVDDERGRFRSFLLGCFKHFLAHEWRKGHAAKRGGGDTTVTLDFSDVLEPVSDRRSPEEEFDRQWALSVLHKVFTELEAKYRNDGKGDLFDTLKGELMSEVRDATLADLAKSLGMKENALKVAAHRLRRRYRDLLRRTVADTLERTELVDDEMQHLLDAL